MEEVRITKRPSPLRRSTPGNTANGSAATPADVETATDIDDRILESLECEREALGGLWRLLVEIADEIEASQEEPSKMEDVA